MIALLRLGVQLLLKRIDQSLIVCAYPEISIPGDWANLCWTRSIVLFERSELLSVPRRNEKFHRKSLYDELSVRIDSPHARAVFWPEYVSAVHEQLFEKISMNKWTAGKHWSILFGSDA